MSDASVEANKALIMRFNDEVFNNHDLAAVDRFLSGNHFNHVTGKSGADDFKRIVRAVLSVAPDSRSEVDEVVAEGDTVVLFLTWSGTHQGEVTLAGRRVLPTGAKFAVSHVHRYRVVDGAITEHFAVRDDLGLLRQLAQAGD
jgi:predicted ester cyclase